MSLSLTKDTTDNVFSEFMFVQKSVQHYSALYNSPVHTSNVSHLEVLNNSTSPQSFVYLSAQCSAVCSVSLITIVFSICSY